MVDTRVRFWRSTTSPRLLLSSIDEKSNQPWKLLRSLKMSGSRKCNSDHSSVMLFCNGVPVIRSLFAELYERSSLMRRQFMFFKRCPSSYRYVSMLNHFVNRLCITYHNDVSPLVMGKELPVIHANLVRSTDNWEVLAPLILKFHLIFPDGRTLFLGSMV